MKVHTADGWVLDVDRRPARGARKGAVIVLHAMMVDRRSMDRPPGQGLASFFADAGWEVFLADFRGHGQSGPTPKQGGSWTYDDLVYGDLPALVAAVRAEGNGPVWVWGLSLGGHVTAASAGAGACDPDGLVLLSANTWLPQLEPSRRRRLRKALQMRGFLWVTRVRGHFPSRRARMGPAEEARPYVEDLAGFWSTDAWRSRDGVDWLAGLRTYTGPVLSVIGRGDALMAHAAGARRWAEHLPGLTFWLVGRGDHGLPMDPDHIGLGADPRCRPLWVAIEAWMARQL